MLEISLERFEKAYPTWIIYRAFDRKIPPTEIRKQPDTLLEDILYIDSVFDPMVGQRLEEYRKRHEAQS